MGINKILLVFLAVILLASFANAVETTVCCEKTTYGAWCQNNVPSKCDTSFNPLMKSAYRTTPTSCDATSYCREGCCYDSQEGVCMENTPQLICQQNNGTWADSASCEIPQCKLGCCILDNQAAFVTLVRCKKLSGFYGVQTNFRTDIKSEPACIAVAQAQDRGACVFEESFVKTCKFTTRGECSSLVEKMTNNATGNITFYKDYLCSAEELGTNCGPTEKTTCVPGKDEIYFQDSCGNPANIYDASRLKDKAYWKKVIQKKDSCGSSSANGNANSQSCGNCDYYKGSFCRQYDKSKDKRPSYGDNICRDLNCKNTVDGNDYRHGESWCVYDDGTGQGKDPAGSRHWKHVCIAGEEIVEPCDDFRQSVCIQDKIETEKGTFQQAGCAANKWENCITFKTKENCENINKGDCRWIDGVIGSAILGNVQQGTTQQTGAYQPNTFGSNQQSTISGTTGTGNAVLTGDASQDSSDSSGKDTEVVTLKGGVCVPDVPPGLKFWTEQAAGQCSMGNAQCQVEYETKGIFGGSKPKCIKNCECESEEWKKKNEEICKSLGDCTGTEGVYKYLQEGFGVSGTTSFWLSLVQESKTINKGLIEGMNNK